MWVFLFIMRVHLLFYIVVFVCCAAIKGLIARRVNLVFVFNRISNPRFTSKFIFVLRIPIKWYILVLVLHSRHNLLSHVWLVTWEVIFVSRIYISVRLVGLCFLIINLDLLSGGGFCQVLMG